ncbi:MAG TPA: hypothetical protein VNU26_16350 [Mycobacteriales bacterium]|nr:hypothetical protein [Mycobacteriales bacterium]
MAVDAWARGLAVASFAVALASLIWNVMAFRRGGSRLRVHALLYDEVLLLWIFNAGRTSDTVERLVVGGTRGGIGGADITDSAGAPFALGPGESRRLELPATILPSQRLAAAASGWDSLWLLLGSMRQRRAELLPVGQARPPTVGWRLAPRTAAAKRYLPLAAVLAVLAVSGNGAAVAIGWTVLLALAAVRAYAAPMRRGFGRLRAERRFCYLGLPVALVATLMPEGSPLVYLVLAYLAGAVVLAWPGAVSRLLEHVAAVRLQLRARSSRVSTADSESLS